ANWSARGRQLMTCVPLLVVGFFALTLRDALVDCFDWDFEWSGFATCFYCFWGRRGPSPPSPLYPLLCVPVGFFVDWGRGESGASNDVAVDGWRVRWIRTTLAGRAGLTSKETVPGTFPFTWHLSVHRIDQNTFLYV